MSKATETELATVHVKISFTPSEFAVVEAARDADDERKTSTWIRKIALRAARGAPSRPVPAFHMGRPVDAAENRRVEKKGGRR